MLIKSTRAVDEFLSIFLDVPRLNFRDYQPPPPPPPPPPPDDPPPEEKPPDEPLEDPEELGLVMALETVLERMLDKECMLFEKAPESNCEPLYHLGW